MSNVAFFCLVDPSSSRRAAISHRMASSGIHIEPFASPSEFPGNFRTCDLLLVFERDSVVKEMIERFAETNTWAPIVAYSEHPTPRQIARVMREGAIEFLVWPFLPEEVATILDHPDEDLIGLMEFRRRSVLARRRLNKITRRERDVLVGMGTGLSTRQIGEKLGISPRTAEIHRYNLLRKLQVDHSYEAIRIAIEALILPSES